ncbi:MAG: hypothetical protein EBR41_05190, partial [Crocinitomicaceae bacterium]|nr:hypothetical protein [Crocinitomicaceae bacterium]
RYLMGNFIVTHNSNGKSKIMELLCHSFGEYTIKFPITMLTGKRAASNAATTVVNGAVTSAATASQLATQTFNLGAIGVSHAF